MNKSNINRAALLHSIDLFSGVSREDLEVLASTLKRHRYRAGQIIFRQGDMGATMYIVSKGRVNIYIAGLESRPISLKDMMPGEYFGELALVDDQPRSASARAQNDIELLELTREMLLHYISAHPHAALAILRTIAKHLRETDRLLAQRVARNVDEEMEKNLTWKDRLADKVTELNGSWAFIVLLLGLSVGWMMVNSAKWLTTPFDPYPFVFYNLVLAILVALQGPLIVMSQNRKALIERARAEADYNVNLKNEVNIETLLHELQQVHQRLEILVPHSTATESHKNSRKEEHSDA
jgi:uncharacterized membrane protein